MLRDMLQQEPSPRRETVACWIEEKLDTDPLIHFENVGLRYGMGPEILRDLTFDIPKKSFQFLTGPSGAGKTTLLRLLFLSLQPTRGLIRMFDRNISTIPRDEFP